MPKGKERILNPATAQRKAEKQRALKKGKAVVAAQRNERLAHRNPERIQLQIDDLKSHEYSSGQLPDRYNKKLVELEREIAQIRKAKEVMGDKYVQRRSIFREEKHGRDDVQTGSGINLGKRKRPEDLEQASISSDTDESVKDIPMPRDTPPPVPWKKRGQESPVSGANLIPVAKGREEMHRVSPVLSQQRQSPQIPTKIVYESRPVVRDLRKGSIGFLPSAVRKRNDLSKSDVTGTPLEEKQLHGV